MVRCPSHPATAVGVLLLGTLALLGCSGPAGQSTGAPGAAGGGRLKVVASTDVWGDIAATIGGDRVQVTSFINDPAQDPHSFEANARSQLAVADADVVVQNGGGYDDFMTTLQAAAHTSAAVLDAVTISGKTAPAGGDLNEHVWYDLPSAAKVADQLAATLGSKDPAHAATFTRNATTLKGQLATLGEEQQRIAATAQGTGVAITEPVPLYLLQACGLVDRTPNAFAKAIEEGTDVPVTALADTQDLFTGHVVRALVYNAQTTGPQTDAVVRAAKANGVSVVAVTETLPDGQHYIGWMTTNLAAVRTAVTK